MKVSVTVVRIITGLLFIFSGLVKAIDPKGLAYKMQEFFEAWGGGGFMPGLMTKLENYALPFSIIMITLEVVVGVALLIGYKRKLTAWILFLLILFFTFLTAYVLFTGKIKACGCFGDCIPLTPIQTFTKDIILLVFALFLLMSSRYILPVFKKAQTILYVSLATVMVLFLQWHVLRNLPVVDCLPYKKGNNIAELRKMPPNAIPDKFDYRFVYEKNGVKKEFVADSIPADWTFVDRKQIVVQKGSNNIPLINDFSLTTENGNDSTDAILAQQSDYYLLFIKDLEGYPAGFTGDTKIMNDAVIGNRKLFIVTSQPQKIKDFFKDKIIVNGQPYMPQVLSCDATVIKTIARVNPTLYLMHGPVVKDKWSSNRFNELDVK